MNYHLMPFGKYAGVPLNELPLTYITHALSSFTMPSELTVALKCELCYRLKIDTLELSEPANSDNVADLKLIFRTLSKKYHPDHGGSTEAQQAINEFYHLVTAKAA